MNITAYRALARSVVLESLRRKDLWVIAIIGFVLILSAGTLGFFGFNGLQVFAKDLGVTVLGTLSTIIAILTSCRLVPDEIRNRTLYPLLARPITRFQLLFGKFLGAVVVTWISFLLLAVVTAVALTFFQVKFELIMLQYMLTKMLGLTIVCAFSMALSVFMTPSAAATMSFIFAFGAPIIVRALAMSGTQDPAMKFGFKMLNGVLPQVNLFDLGGRAVYFNWTLVPAWVIGFLVVYAVLYCSAMLSISWLKFRKQAV